MYSPPRNGSHWLSGLLFSVVPPGTKSEFGCRPGYGLNVSDTTTCGSYVRFTTSVYLCAAICQNDGTWSIPIPTCELNPGNLNCLCSMAINRVFP